MRRTKMTLIAIVAVFITLLALGSDIGIYASADSTKSITALPDFLESYLQMQAKEANMTSSQIVAARALWIHQLSLTQQRIESTKGAVLNAATSQGSWMSTFIRSETWAGGTVTNQYNINGLIDGYFTRFYTPNPPGHDDSAAVMGRMSSSNSHGDVYIRSKLGPNGAGHTGNYFVIEVANDPNADRQTWINGFVGAPQVNSPYSGSGVDQYVGPAPFAFSYISVGAVVMPPPNTLDPYNDVMADSVWSTLG